MSPQEAHHDDVTIDVFSSAGLCRGILRVPPGTTLLEHVNRAGEHLRLGDASLEDDPQHLPFLAVRRENVHIVVPRDAHGLEIAAPRLDGGKIVDVAGVMDLYRFHGKVRLAPAQRVTDFFAAAPAFVPLRDASIWRSGGPNAKPLETTVALIRAHAVIAFSDTLE